MSFPSPPAKPRILVAPLDWGLGHATRCAPIIRCLLDGGADVVLAAEGKTAALLAAEFPQLTVLPLKGYHIQYARNKVGLIGKILLQIPKILLAIRTEHRWLQKRITQQHFDAVISDNRYGLYSKRVYSVFITHQLLVKTGMGMKADRLLQKLQYRFIQSFNECWIPDREGASSLAGELSHPYVMPKVAVEYLGTISRFKFTSRSSSPKHLLILLSGPEPQRSLLEQRLTKQLKKFRSPVVMVRGLPSTEETFFISHHVQVFNHLPTAAMQELIRDAVYVIARSGYSTVMDLMRLRKKSILIPTPGQTEQEYLAHYLMTRSFALCLPQAKFSLLHALDAAASFHYNFPPAQEEDVLPKVITQFLNTLNASRVNQFNH